MWGESKREDAEARRTQQVKIRIEATSLPGVRANPCRILFSVPMKLWGGSDMEWEGGVGSAPRSMC